MLRDPESKHQLNTRKEDRNPNKRRKKKTKEVGNLTRERTDGDRKGMTTILQNGRYSAKLNPRRANSDIIANEVTTLE
jgi:hypothetical protein